MNKMKQMLTILAMLGITCLVFADTAPKAATSKSGIRMVLLPGGTFKMGSDSGREDEKPLHLVTLSPFYMDICEVSQDEFERACGNNPSRFRDRQGPVERTRWTDAAAYCNARSAREGLKPCYDPKTWACDFTADGYRLPTEAEWEYACRAGTAASTFCGDGEREVEKYAWFRGNSGEKVHKVGSKRANPWGLHDMYGNVAEWCNDFYDPGYYQVGAKLNPTGPESGAKRVLRGGSWASRPKYLTSAAREADSPVTADICQGYDTYGFRCVRRAE